VCMQLNAYVSHIYRLIDTKFRIRACIGGMYIMPESVFRNLDFYDPRCICA